MGTGASFNSEALSSSEEALDPTEFRKFRVTKIVQVSPNTKLFEISYPKSTDYSGMKVSFF